MNNHQLIDKIALISYQISQKNRIVREGKEAQKEVDKLEAKLKPLMKKFLHQEERQKEKTPQIHVLAKFNGNNKDFRKLLAEEVRKHNHLP